MKNLEKKTRMACIATFSIIVILCMHNYVDGKKTNKTSKTKVNEINQEIMKSTQECDCANSPIVQSMLTELKKTRENQESSVRVAKSISDKQTESLSRCQKDQISLAEDYNKSQDEIFKQQTEMENLRKETIDVQIALDKVTKEKEKYEKNDKNGQESDENDDKTTTENEENIRLNRLLRMENNELKRKLEQEEKSKNQNTKKKDVKNNIYEIRSSENRELINASNIYNFTHKIYILTNAIIGYIQNSIPTEYMENVSKIYTQYKLTLWDPYWYKLRPHYNQAVKVINDNKDKIMFHPASINIYKSINNNFNLLYDNVNNNIYTYSTQLNRLITENVIKPMTKNNENLTELIPKSLFDRFLTFSVFLFTLIFTIYVFLCSISIIIFHIISPSFFFLLRSLCFKKKSKKKTVVRQLVPKNKNKETPKFNNRNDKNQKYDKSKKLFQPDDEFPSFSSSTNTTSSPSHQENKN